MLDDNVRRKRKHDLDADAVAGFDTTAEEDARLRQTHLYGGTTDDPSHGEPDTENDEYDEQAERMTRSIERSDGFKYSGQFADPEKRREFVEGLADALRGGNGNGRKRAQPREPEDKPFSSNEFWSSDEPKKIMPKKF